MKRGCGGSRTLIELTTSCGVLSRFSRLVCDPNRDVSEESFVVRLPPQADRTAQPESYSSSNSRSFWISAAGS